MRHQEKCSQKRGEKMIRKTEEPEKTISGLIKTIYDWDNLDLVAEAIEMMNNMHIVEPSPYVPGTWVGDLRYNEFGEMVAPPRKPRAPEPIDTSNWKRITPKRREMLAQYRRDMEYYEVALVEYEKKMEEWLELPTSKKTKMESILEGYEELGRVLRSEKGFIFLDVLPKQYRSPHKVKITECDPTNNYWTQMGFEGHASNERRHYKRNRSIPKEDWADTDLETGEQLQRTLFNFTEVRGYNPNPRTVVSYDLFESFKTKPNTYLSRAYLDYLINGTPLTDWQKFQLNKRMTKTVSVKEGQQTLL